jgi:hypothetical protein
LFDFFVPSACCNKTTSNKCFFFSLQFMHILSFYPLSYWVFILLAAFAIGLAKGGLKGVDMLAVTIMALVFGGKSSTGIVLPLLCVADWCRIVLQPACTVETFLEIDTLDDHWYFAWGVFGKGYG